MSDVTSSSKITPKQKGSARLYAVQAVYEMIMNDQPVGLVMDDIIGNRAPLDPEFQGLAHPAPDLFRSIVMGVHRQINELLDVISKTVKEGVQIEQMRERDPLLLSILLCGAYELMAHLDIDAPIIMNDYLNVAHAYYPGAESRIVNGVLDTLRPLYRPQ